MSNDHPDPAPGGLLPELQAGDYLATKDTLAPVGVVLAGQRWVLRMAEIPDPRTGGWTLTPVPEATRPVSTPPAQPAGATDIEAISAKVHDQWMETKRSKGVTSRKSEAGEELMVAYDQLSEAAKDLDRGSVRAVLSAQAALATPRKCLTANQPAKGSTDG